MKLPFRLRHHACIHPDTYKYFLPPDRVRAVWHELELQFGLIEKVAGFGTSQINAENLFLRTTAAGNPITVIRKRATTEDDIRRLHAILGFDDAASDEPDPWADSSV